MLRTVKTTFTKLQLVHRLAQQHGSIRTFHCATPLQALVRKPFVLADIGEGITECEIVKWHVEKDQVVEEFDPVVEVMSDKATVEITSPYSGKILELNGAVGEVVKVGKQLLQVEVEDDSVQEESSPAPPSSAESPSSSQPSSSSPPPPSETNPTPSGGSKTDVLATPSTRRIARENNISLNDVTGTGKDGRVTKGDVLDFVNSGGATTSTSKSTTSEPSRITSPKSTSITPANLKPIPLSSLRKAMYKSMTSSLNIPHFAYSDSLDITELERLRLQLNEGIPLEYRKTLTPKEETELERRAFWTGRTSADLRVDEAKRFDKITLMPLLIKAMALAMEENPLFKCLLSPTAAANGGGAEEPMLIPQSEPSISVAFSASPEGLFLPTIASVSTLSPFAIASQMSHLASITPFSPPPAYRSPASFTLSNIGAIGGTTTHPVIPPNSGQLGIVAIGRQRVEEMYLPGQEKAVRQAAIDSGDGKSLKRGPRILLDATFTADHRVVEGVELARFAESWKRIIEAPGLLGGVGV